MAITRRNIFDEYHLNLEDVKKSKKWFDDRVALIQRGRRVSSNKVHLASNHLTFNIVPGNLYLFYYDAKYKDTLPYWDQFPCVFPFRSVPGGFLGLNLHYLPYKERFALFKALLSLNGSAITPNLKMKYSWGMINSMAAADNAQFCIKHYLHDHLASPLSKVAPEDWVTAMLMPVEKFVGQSKEQVWKKIK